jgi:glycine C-acetyltransferase
MKALVKNRAEVGLWLDNVAAPEPGINDVLIKVHKTGICGTDLHIYEWDDWARKALGCACGGYTSGRREIIQWLRQRSRPYLFSNSLPPTITAVTLKVLQLLRQSDDLRRVLFDNTIWFRQRMLEEGFQIPSGEHPIVPVMVGDAAKAVELSDRLLQKRIYVIAFSYPVVPKDKARIRVQLSAAQTRSDLELAVRGFAEARRERDL